MTTTVRVPENQAERLRRIATVLDWKISEAANLALSESKPIDLGAHIALDADLSEELTETVTAPDIERDSDVTKKMDEIKLRQVERNIARSDVEPSETPSVTVTETGIHLAPSDSDR